MAGNGIHPGFRHLVNGAAAGKQHPGSLFIFIFYAVSRTVGDDAGQHHARGIGHGTYNARSVAGAGFHIIQGNGGCDRNQKGKLRPRSEREEMSERTPCGFTARIRTSTASAASASEAAS